MNYSNIFYSSCKKALTCKRGKLKLSQKQSRSSHWVGIKALMKKELSKITIQSHSPIYPTNSI